MKIITVLALFAFAYQLGALEGSVEGKVSYFYPTNNTTRGSTKRTTRGLFDDRVLYGVEGAVGDQLGSYHSLFGYVGVNLYPSSGRTNQGTRTKIKLVPIEIGIKYLLSVQEYVNMYIGAAATPFYVHTNDDSPFVVRKRSKWDIGGTFKGGLLFFPRKKHFFVDVFLAYYLMQTKFSDTDKSIGRKGDISGLSAGGGLGWEF